jgi:hypothetical protein
VGIEAFVAQASSLRICMEPVEVKPAGVKPVEVNPVLVRLSVKDWEFVWPSTVDVKNMLLMNIAASEEMR